MPHSSLLIANGDARDLILRRVSDPQFIGRSPARCINSDIDVDSPTTRFEISAC